MRRLFHILSQPIALVGWLIVLSKPLLRLIERAGDVDFLIENWSTVNAILLTGWGTVGTVVTGFSIIGFSIYRNPDVAALFKKPELPDQHGDSRDTNAIYKKWDTVDLFTVWQAAYLWVDKEPVDIWAVQHPESVAFHTWQTMRNDIRAQQLAVAYHNPNTGVITVSRDALVKYALSSNQKPAFLFSEVRRGDRKTS